MNKGLAEIWAYLTTSPLLSLTVTLLAYLAGNALYQRSGQNPLFNPVAIAIALLVGLLALTGIPYRVYFDGAQFVHFLLGPATVALAVPLFVHAGRVRRMLLPVLGALLLGSLTAISSAVMLIKWLGGSREILLSMAPKSATTPVAMGVAEKIGGLPSLTAALVIITGILGAITGTWLFRLLGLRNDAVQGFAIGVASHGIGTARAFHISDMAGAFAGLGMGFNALVTVLLTPVIVKVLG